MSVEHHPLIASIPRREHLVPGGSVSDQIVCSHHRYAFTRGFPGAWVPPAEPYSVLPKLPGFDDEYFDWCTLAESVAAARERFVFMELGAGYGRWLVRALKLACDWRRLPAFGIAVEAEPSHFEFMTQHCQDNGIDPSQLCLVRAAVDARDGEVPFAIGSADEWYGQSIARNPVDAPIEMVPAVSLRSVIERAGVETIDFLHMDVQRAEGEIIPASLDTLNRHVRTICVGIHGKAGVVVREALTRIKWRCDVDYPRKTTCPTPYGEITFGDGVQVWRNPALND